jgi:endoglucanase
MKKKNTKRLCQFVTLIAASCLLVACGGTSTENHDAPVARLAPQMLVSSATTATSTTCPEGDISGYPAVPNVAPPGASEEAYRFHELIGRGINFGGMFDAAPATNIGQAMKDDYIVAARAAGFQSMRLPVRWSSHAAATAPYAIDEVFMTRVEHFVDLALANGMQVVLDMHHYRQFDGDNLNYNEPAVDGCIVDVRFLSMWQQIAQRFKDKSSNLAFELYNEPHGRLTAAKWNDMAARALYVVRATNPSRLVVIGPAEYDRPTSLSAFRVPEDPNLIVTFHSYEPFTFTHQGAEWLTNPMPVGKTCCDSYQRGKILIDLNAAQTWSNDPLHRYPVYLGEFGAYYKADMQSRVNYTRFIRNEAERRNIRWTYWNFSAGFGVYDTATDTWYNELKEALLGV